MKQKSLLKHAVEHLNRRNKRKGKVVNKPLYLLPLLNLICYHVPEALTIKRIINTLKEKFESELLRCLPDIQIFYLTI